MMCFGWYHSVLYTLNPTLVYTKAQGKEQSYTPEPTVHPEWSEQVVNIYSPNNTLVRKKVIIVQPTRSPQAIKVVRKNIPRNSRRELSVSRGPQRCRTLKAG